MSLENVQRAVLDAAKRQADHIVEAARKQAAERVAHDVDLARRDIEHREALETRAIDDAFARQLIQIGGAAHKALLEKRNERLADLFARARKAILAWSPERYAAAMRRALAQTAGDRGGRVRVHADDRGLFESLLSEINPGRAPDAQLTLDAGALDVRGGFVLLTATFEVDQTLDTRLADLERDLAPEIARSLFAT